MTNALDRSPIHLLHRASQCVDDLFGRAVTSGLTPRQLALLATVANNPGCNQTILTARTGIDRSTMAEMMKRLLKKGLLSRRRSKTDTRAYVVTLTDNGARVLKSAEPLAKRVDEAVLRALGNRGPAFVDNLATLARNLEVSAKT